MEKKNERKLRRFLEIARKMNSQSYLTSILQNEGTNFTFTWSKDGGSSITDNFPNSEQVDATVLSARMFMQNNDITSFENMSNVLDDPSVSEDWKECFVKTRRELNAFLNTKVAGSVKINDVEHTYKEIFDIFVYGHLAHSNAEKAAIYETWQKSPLAMAMTKSYFHECMVRLISAVIEVAVCTEKELAGIDQN